MSFGVHSKVLKRESNACSTYMCACVCYCISFVLSMPIYGKINMDFSFCRNGSQECEKRKKNRLELNVAVWNFTIFHFRILLFKRYVALSFIAQANRCVLCLSFDVVRHYAVHCASAVAVVVSFSALFTLLHCFLCIGLGFSSLSLNAFA